MLAAALIGIAVIGLAPYFRRFLETQETKIIEAVGEQKYHLYKEIATDAVEAVRQSAKEGATNEEKKAMAMEIAKNLLALKGYDPEEHTAALDALVEAAYFGLKFAESLREAKN